MSRQTSQRIAAILLFLFGIFEVMGLLMLIIPSEYLPTDLETQSMFWGLLSCIYGLSRLVAGLAIWKNKQWGYVWGLLLCVTTMIVAPTIVPFGVIDLVLTMVILVCLLYAKYGNDEMVSRA